MLTEQSGPRSAIPPHSNDASATINDNVSSERWYVVHTQTRAESRAIFHLERQGYRVFCPRYRKVVRHARTRTNTLAPLFPNHLFLKLDVSRDHWRAVNGTRGVVRLITQDETPQPDPRGIVEALQVQMRADDAMNWTPTFKIGQAVRIADGPFADFVGTLERLDAAGRVRVLLDLLGRSVSVVLRCEALMLAA
jgi:transcription elongation factor/antiterminator RfaH